MARRTCVPDSVAIAFAARMTDSIHKWEYVRGVVVAYSTEGVLRDADWNATLHDLRTSVPLLGYLGASVGSVEVTSQQRKAAVEVMRERQKPTAIVTDNRLVIGLTTAAGWLGARIKAFSWTNTLKATEFLKVPAADAEAVLETLERLRKQAEDQAAG